MSVKISVEEVLATLEQRAIFHREQEAPHVQKAVEHQAEQALHMGGSKVLKSLSSGICGTMVRSKSLYSTH